MPEISSYKDGQFCWADLSTSDQRAAKSFYNSVFGRSVEDIPMGDANVSVSNVDDSAKKAKSLGANVVAPPFDVMDAGRMAVIADPQGAMLCIWQAKNSIGAQINNENNTMCWNELMTGNIESARKFYSDLFGWKLKVSPEYTEIHAGDRGVGGMMQMDGLPPNWIPYFAVADADATAKKIKSAGGKIHKPPTDIPNTGRFSVVADPQGAWFAIIQIKM